MFGLHHFYTSWGFILQLAALFHFVRRRADSYWFFIILMGGYIGALIYIVVEVAPDLGLIGGVFKSQGRKTRIKEVETAIIDNPSPANYEELGLLYFDEKQFAKAREAYNHSIAVRGDSVDAFYRRGLCAIELGEFEASLPDMEHVVYEKASYDSHRAASMLAYAYGKAAQTNPASPEVAEWVSQADAWFGEVTKHLTTPETLYHHAEFLNAQGRREQTKEALDHLSQKKRTLPRYMQRYERPWFLKGKALEKSLEKKEGDSTAKNT